MIEEIQRAGPISTARFMALALTHPTLGYYARHDPLGAAGDFVTAPEISQVFGELVGLWLARAWSDLGRPDPCLLVELGPGRGTLMADILRATAQVPGFRASLRLHLVETSAAPAQPAARAARGRDGPVAQRARRGAAGNDAAGRQRVPRRAAGPSAGGDRARLGRAHGRAGRDRAGVRVVRAALGSRRKASRERAQARPDRRGQPGAQRHRRARSAGGSPQTAASRCWSTTAPGPR